MSICKLIPSLLVTSVLAAGFAAAPPAQAQSGGANVVITDLNLQGVAVDPLTGVVTATEGTVSGTIAGLPFTTDITDFELELMPDPMDGGCSILHLALAPIDLDLLGAHVDTSAICLNITAFPDQGLLGQVLCSVAGGNLGLLDGLLDGLTDVMSGALTESLANADAPAADAQDICDGECEVLDLAVGPVDLTLLGLNVHLDNCEDGPVQVCVSASAGEGLLGDLLCGLADGSILPDLGNLQDLINGLAGLDLTQLDNLTTQQINKLVRQLSKSLRNGVLTPTEIDKLVKSIGKLLGRV
jgi:hypothetical protein